MQSGSDLLQQSKIVDYCITALLKDFGQNVMGFGSERWREKKNMIKRVFASFRE